MSQLHIRWLIKVDMPAVLDIEQAGFGEFAWSEDDFIRCLRERNCIGIVAELDDRILGYCIYELEKKGLFLFTVAVHPDHRGKGIGRKLVEKLTGKLWPTRRVRVKARVRETNIDALRFFQRLGFRAIALERGFYESHGHDCDEDAIVMQYRVRTEAKV